MTRDLFVLLVRDPRWVFAYWELSSAIVPRHLRIHDVTAGTYSDISLNGSPSESSPGSWYANVSAADHTYIAELGIWEGENFKSFWKSNPVHTPRDTFADDDGEEIWMSRFGSSLRTWRETLEFTGSGRREILSQDELSRLVVAQETSSRA